MIKKLSFIVLILFVSCSKIIPNRKVRIGVDPTFFSSPVGNKQGVVYAFSMELLSEVFDPTRYDIIYKELSFDNTLDSLNDGDSDLVISSLPIIYETSKLYTFSSTFLSLGDVFVTRKNEKADFSFYNGKIIAIRNNPEIVSLFANYPEVTLSYYSFIPAALEMIAGYTIDAAIIPYISLSSHLSSEYRNLLNIQTNRLTDKGLRLISVKNKNKGIIRTFNKRLASLIDNGSFENLLIKWNLTL